MGISLSKKLVTRLLAGIVLVVAAVIGYLFLTSQAPSMSIEDRIRRIENGLMKEWGDPPWQKMELTERMEHHNVPGVSIAVINNYEIEWVKAYGVLEAGKDDPVTPHTLFQAASISKPVSSTATMHYVDEGLLNLDEPVNNKLVLWKIPENEFTALEDVTLRHLLSHSAGFPTMNLYGYREGEPIPTLLQILDGVSPSTTPPIRVQAVPGAGYTYANGGFIVLQQLLTDATGKPFADLMQEIVLDPIGMDSSTFEQPLRGTLRDEAAIGHGIDGTPMEEKWRVFPEQAAGGLWTTPSDLARFAIEIMLSKRGQSHGILSQDIVAQMLTPQIGGAGLGFGLGDDGGDRIYFMHKGANEGFKCVLVGYYERGQGVVIMTNSENGDALYEELLKSISIEYEWVEKGIGIQEAFIIVGAIVIAICLFLLWRIRRT